MTLPSKLRLFKVTFFIVYMCIQAVYAQDFGKVTVKEIKQQYHPSDSTAPAAVLFNTGKLNIKDESKFEVKKRIKIYNNQGYKYATIKLFYNSKYSDIIRLNACTYNLSNGKIQKIKLSKDQIIKEETTKNYNQIKFTFPNLKNGSIIEYSYTKNIFFLDNLPEWQFQADIPVNYSTYELITPKYIKFNEIKKGFHLVEKRDESNIRYDKFIYSSTNLPSLKELPFVNNIDNYKTSIRHEFSSISNTFTNQTWGFSNNWNELSLSLEEDSNFGKELSQEKYFKEDIDKIINKSKSDKELIEGIFTYVQTRMNWNERFSIFSSDKLKRIYHKKIGNSADINLMLTAMLRYAEFQAHPVLVSTIDYGMPSHRVSLFDYNSVITAVELSKNKIILLDASNEFSTTSILPTCYLNLHGRLIRPNGTNRIINLVPKLASDFMAIMNIKLEKSGILNGKIRRVYSDQNAYEYRNNIESINKEDYINSLNNQFNINISEFEVNNTKHSEKPIVETFSFKKENAIDLINDDLYLSPLLFLALAENPFKLEQIKREIPIDFTFPKAKRYIVNIEVPKNYMITYTPEDMALELSEKVASYRFNISQNNETNIQIMVEENINKSMLSANYYTALKEFYGNIVNKENDKIVLIKKHG